MTVRLIEDDCLVNLSVAVLDTTSLISNTLANAQFSGHFRPPRGRVNVISNKKMIKIDVTSAVPVQRISKKHQFLKTIFQFICVLLVFSWGHFLILYTAAKLHFFNAISDFLSC